MEGGGDVRGGRGATRRYFKRRSLDLGCGLILNLFY